MAASSVEVALQPLPSAWLNGDRHMVQTTENLCVRTQVEAWEVEERQQVAVTDIKEEMVGTLVVAILKDLRERELEHVLVEADGAFNVSTEHRDMVQPTSGGRWPLVGRSQVGRAYSSPLFLDSGQVDVSHDLVDAI
jgi:hypothetical protein